MVLCRCPPLMLGASWRVACWRSFRFFCVYLRDLGNLWGVGGREKLAGLLSVRCFAGCRPLSSEGEGSYLYLYLYSVLPDKR